ncbi:MFS transporter [Microbacterium sp. NPDC089696]|uniref:MFS transporter n=1 Tax=Microbacterium sp. NPDC089696 TaxID=3364199 RepID=UPI003810CA93
MGYGTFGVPQAAAPIAFSLLALPLTGSAEAGSGMVFAMTVTQVIAATPLSRFGTRFNPVSYLRALLIVRTVALLGVTYAAYAAAPMPVLITAAAAAGLTNGAAYGYQRSLLNYLVEPERLPRALGIAATLNEVTFAVSPVLAAALGAVSPVFAMFALTVLGIGPLVLMPSVPQAQAPVRVKTTRRTPLPKAIYIWLVCAAAGSGVVAAVEVGAVPFAVLFGLAPEWGFIFALTLCIGSVAGGVWVSIRNRILTRRQVVTFLVLTSAGAVLVGLRVNIALLLAGAVLVGFCLPALGTYYSLVLDQLSPPERRAEVFALMKTSNALGIVGVSGVLAIGGLDVASVAAMSFIVVATLAVIVFFQRSQRL